MCVDDLFGMSPVAVVPMAGARAGVWPLAGRHEEKRGGSRPYTMARRRCPTVILYLHPQHATDDNIFCALLPLPLSRSTSDGRRGERFEAAYAGMSRVSYVR